MKEKIISVYLKTTMLALLFFIGGMSIAQATSTAKKPMQYNACELPSQPASSQDETAWQLFVAINCKTANNQLTWETWKTQACLNNPADCDTRKLKGSLLRAKLGNGAEPRRTGGCSPMTTAATADPSLVPYVPKNLGKDPEFCEEVTINPDEQSYATTNGLLTDAGQIQYLQSGKTIDFSTGSVEVKADWVAASSFVGVNFDCSKPNTGIYKEMINGTCYALVGIHISSKLYPNWLWATFEPQDLNTNPNRCNPGLYNACYDSWGSNPVESKGDNTLPTAALTQLFNSAGSQLDPSFQNYRLTGTQTVYSQPVGSAGKLGSSFVEFNANVPAQQASCITCHSYAQRTTAVLASAPAPMSSPLPAGSTPLGGAPNGYANVGTPTPLPTAFKPLDFSWFLGFGVPKGCMDVNAGPIWDNNDAQTKCPTVCAQTITSKWNGQWTTTQQGVMSVCGCCGAD